MPEIKPNFNPMKIKSFTFNPFMENTYVLSDSTSEAVIIDPGCYNKMEEEELVEYINGEGIKVKLILNTHGHIDHVLGNSFCKEYFNVPLWIGDNDLETLKSVEVYTPNYGFNNYQATQPDRLLSETEKIKFGNSTLEILFVPGHAPGHIAFFDKSKEWIIGGDVLFEQSIGRTDLPGGDFETLKQSIFTKFYTFPDNTVVYSGHGETTTIGKEKKSNPFCTLPNK